MTRIYKSSDRRLPSEIRALFAAVTEKKQFSRPTMALKVLKGAGVNDDMNVEGIANFVAPDRVRESILPGAWILDNYLKVPVILRDHDHSLPVGLSTDVKAKEDGLYYKGIIGRPSMGQLTACQLDTRSLLAQGVLKANSVGFLPYEAEYDDQDDILRYTKVELLEITICSVPMQQDSLITAVKSWKEKIVMAGKSGEVEVTMGELKALIETHTEISKGMVKQLDDVIKEKNTTAEENKALKVKVAELEASVKTVTDAKAAQEKEFGEMLDDMEKKGWLPKEEKAS